MDGVYEVVSGNKTKIDNCDGVEVEMATLYLSEQYSVVKVEGEALRVQFPTDSETKQRGKVVRIPLAKIDQVMVLGDVTLTTPALHLLMERRVPVHYLSVYGKSFGGLAADPAKNTGVRLTQYKLASTYEQCFEVAKQCIAGKLVNMRAALLRYARKREVAAFADAAQELRDYVVQLGGLAPHERVDATDRMHGLGAIFGLEGQASAVYYGVFGLLLKDGWEFPGRVKRPPTDPVNALLSFGYTILTNQMVSQIWAVGLDPGIGVLHQPGFGKPALALDLVEQFRPLIVDSVVTKLINTGQIEPSDFTEEMGRFMLKDEPRKLFLTKLEERLSEKVQHTVFGYSTTYRRCMELQVRLFAKYAQGEIDAYIPFTTR